MIIFNNLPGLNAFNKLQRNEKKTTSSLEKLASGLRIGKAADDAAGLSISEKMRGQIRGLTQAARNIQDGLSLIDTADGGLQNIQTPPLERLRELAIQAANDTLTTEDRKSMQLEVDQLTADIMQTVRGTTFGSQPAIKDEYSRLERIIGDVDISGGVQIVSGLNDELQFEVDGKQVSVLLDNGRYNRNDFVDMLNDKLWEKNPLLIAGVSPESKLMITAFGHDVIDKMTGNGVSLFYNYHIGSSDGLLKGSSIMNGPLIIVKNLNSELNFSLDGKEYTISLDEGKYLPDNLVLAINTAFQAQNLPITASLQGQSLQLEAPNHFIDSLSGDFIDINNVTSPLFDNIKAGSQWAPTVYGQAYLTGNIKIDSSNGVLQFDVDGASKGIIISSGTYNLGSLVNEINKQLTDNSIQVTAYASGSQLVFKHDRAGSSHTLGGFHGSAYAGLMERYDTIPSSSTTSSNITSSPMIIGQRDLSLGITLDSSHRTVTFTYDGNNVKVDLTAGVYNQATLKTEFQNKIDLAIGNPMITGNKNLLAKTVTIGIADNTLSFDYNGTNKAITLNAGTFDQASLLSNIQDNLDAVLGAGEVTAAYNNGNLILTAAEVRSLSNPGDSAVGSLFGSFTETTDASGNPAIRGNLDLSLGATLDASNNQLSFNYNGSSVLVNLDTGTFDAVDLLGNIQGKINAVIGTNKVTASLDSGKLVLANVQPLLSNLGGSGANLLFGSYNTTTGAGGNEEIAGARDLSNGLITIDNMNSTLAFAYNGVAKVITLNTGYYNPSSLLGEIQSKFDDILGAGTVVAAYNDSGRLTLTNNKLGTLDSFGGKAYSTLLNGYSTIATNPGKVAVDYNDNYLTLTHPQMSGTLTNIGGSAGDMLFSTYISVTAPTSNYYSSSGFTGKGYTEVVHQEGIAMDTYNYYAGRIQGSTDLSTGLIVDSNNNTLQIWETTAGGSTPRTITLAQGNYSADTLLSALKTQLSGSHIKASYNSSGNLVLTHDIAGDNNNFTVSNTSLGRALLEKQVVVSSAPQYRTGGVNTLYATYTGTKSLSDGITLSAPATLRFTTDSAAYEIELDSGAYSTINDIVNSINSKLGSAGINSIEASNSSGHLQLINKQTGSGHTITVDNSTSGYSELFRGQQLVTPTYISGSTVQTRAIGQKDISGGVSVVAGENDIFELYLDGVQRQVTLNSGIYDENGFLAQLNSKLGSYQVSANSIGGKVILNYDNDTAGNHSITKIGGTASYSFFYNGSEAPSASYINGQRDISEGVKIIPGTNDTFKFELDGQSVSIILSEGSYSASQIAAEVDSKLVAANIDISASLTPYGRLQLKHNRAGRHTIDQITGNASTSVFYNDTGSRHEDDALDLQVGANSGDTFKVDPPKINLEVLGLDNLTVTSAKSANQALKKIDHAILVSAKEQARVGTYQNALQHTLANVSNTEENLTSAESRIRDVDMAKEVMNFQKNNILSQAAQAMLAQANQQPQGVLQLLR